MSLRARLLLLSVSTVALLVCVLFGLHLNSLVQMWLDSAVEHTEAAGRQIQAFMLRRIEIGVAGVRPVPQTLTETKAAWNEVVSNDEDLPAVLQQSMVQSRELIEINICDENGMILASSYPGRKGTAAKARQDLRVLRNARPLDRLVALLESRTDYETRASLSIVGQQRPVFDIQLLVSPVLLREAIRPELNRTALASVLALLAATVLAVVSSSLALRPVERIGHAIDTIRSGEPITTTNPPGDREVAIVESKLSLLGEQVRGAMRDAGQARETVQSLVRGVAHEIKNPLNSIALRLDILRSRLGDQPPEVEFDLDIVSSEVTRLDRVVRTFLDLSRPIELEARPLDANRLLRDVVELVRPAAQQARVELAVETESVNQPIEADEGLLMQALLNVLNNAIEAMQDGGKLTATTSDCEEGCRFSMMDTGPGIPPEVKARIFEPYFTTKTTGSGIGLAFTWRVLQLHGGTVTAEDNPGGGTRFELTIPRQQVENG